MDFESLRSRLFSLLPGFLILLLLGGIVIFSIRMLLPLWQDYTSLSEQADTGNAMISTQVAERSDNQNLAMLDGQINNVAEKLDAASAVFLNEREAEQVLNRLYDYAYLRGVRVVNLQAQQPAVEIVTTAYNTSMFQLQMSGEVTRLIDFVAHFPEASLPAVSIVNLNTAQGSEQAILTLTLMIYTSPYASGEVLAQLAAPPPPPTETPTPVPTETPLPTATPTASPTPEIPVTEAPTSTPVPPTATLIPTATWTPTLVPTLDVAENQIICNGVPSMFTPGDIAVVDFNGLGALRMLSDPNAAVMSTRTQAYDNHQLEIIAGPVCASGSYYWYVRNLSQNNTLGWVAEGRNGERWLCPEYDQECVPE